MRDAIESEASENWMVAGVAAPLKSTISLLVDKGEKSRGKWAYGAKELGSGLNLFYKSDSLLEPVSPDLRKSSSVTIPDY